MNTLDGEPIKLIFENLITRELIRCRIVSKSLRRIIDSILDLRSKHLITIAQGNNADYHDWQNVGKYCTPMSISQLHICDEFKYEILRGAYAEKREDIVRLFLANVNGQCFGKTFERITRYAYRENSEYLKNKISLLVANYSRGIFYHLDYHLAKYGFDERSAREICGRAFHRENFFEGIGFRGSLPTNCPSEGILLYYLYRGICRSGNIELAKLISDNCRSDILFCKPDFYYHAIGKSGNVELVKWFFSLQPIEFGGQLYCMESAIIKHHLAIVKYIDSLLPIEYYRLLSIDGLILRDINVCKLIIPKCISAGFISSDDIWRFSSECAYPSVANYLQSLNDSSQ
ncbi:MAG: F-box protein [Methylomonas sp.]|jgi:hypothetical protein|uniref:F-box protein n=1 Tax=Methylomonas sp. TaxID=418 RepID=UPI0025F68BF5|nr:F-box protein [Methylomonas sp.]MCK9607803.1 F-box protein [Methylomonas sp.]